MPRLDGVVALVTGAASGLGLAIVERFVAEGARVVAVDRSADRLTTLDGRAEIETVVGDVTRLADNAAAVSAATGRWGRLDVFVANAGIWDFAQDLQSTPSDTLDAGFDEIFAVNVKGPLVGAKAALEPLRASGGSFIVTLSNSSFYPAGGGPLYVASKHAGVGLVRQLAYELAPEIRVNGVAPGGMATDLRGPRSLGMDQVSIQRDVPIREILAETSALHRVATAEDYVSAYVLLAASDESASITGTVLDISGFGTPRRPAQS